MLYLSWCVRDKSCVHYPYARVLQSRNYCPDMAATDSSATDESFLARHRDTVADCSHYMYWSRSQAEALETLNAFFPAMQDRLGRLRLHFDSLHKRVIPKYAHWLPKYELREYIWSYLQVRSRVWTLPEGKDVLVPFQDLINHGHPWKGGRNVELRLAKDERGKIFEGSLVHRPIEQGQELLVSYGNETGNLQLVMVYGFSLIPVAFELHEQARPPVHYFALNRSLRLVIKVALNTSTLQRLSLLLPELSTSGSMGFLATYPTTGPKQGVLITFQPLAASLTRLVSYARALTLPEQPAADIRRHFVATPLLQEERLALVYVIELCRTMLSKYKTSLLDDLHLAQRDLKHGDISSPERQSLHVRLEEKLILQTVLSAATTRMHYLVAKHHCPRPRFGSCACTPFHSRKNCI
jgi:hypothetical protein